MEWFLLFVGFCLVLGTAFFVAVEFSLVALDQSFVRKAVQEGDRAAEPLLRCLTSLSTQLSSCQLGITLTTLLTGFTMEPAWRALVGVPLISWGVPDGIASGVAFAASMLVATFVSMLLGELIPKNLAISVPFVVGKWTARPQLLVTAVFRPVVTVLNGVANAVLRRLGLEVREELSSARDPEELASLVRRSARSGTLAQGTAHFLERSLRFSRRTAADVMIPRIRVEMVADAAALPDMIELSRRTGFSRFPVFSRSSDDIVGVVHVKRALMIPADKRSKLTVGHLQEKVLKVPDTIHLNMLIRQLRAGNLQLAVVVDEYAGTAGIVTLEDVVEEIVGEVADEHDRSVPGMRQLSAGRWFVSGLLRPDEVSDRVPSLKVPDAAHYETVGGFIMAALGRVPRLGDRVNIDGGELVVRRMDGRRVDRAEFLPKAEGETEHG